jgi:hypothetical protein
VNNIHLRRLRRSSAGKKRQGNAKFQLLHGKHIAINGEVLQTNNYLNLDIKYYSMSILSMCAHYSSTSCADDSAVSIELTQFNFISRGFFANNSDD